VNRRYFFLDEKKEFNKIKPDIVRVLTCCKSVFFDGYYVIKAVLKDDEDYSLFLVKSKRNPL